MIPHQIICFDNYRYEMSRAMRKSVFEVSDQVRNKVDRVQPQKITRGLKIRIKEEDGLYYLCSERKGADQPLICAYVCAYAKAGFLMTRLK